MICRAINLKFRLRSVSCICIDLVSALSTLCFSPAYADMQHTVAAFDRTAYPTVFRKVMESAKKADAEARAVLI